MCIATRTVDELANILMCKHHNCQQSNNQYLKTRRDFSTYINHLIILAGIACQIPYQNLDLKIMQRPKN